MKFLNDLPSGPLDGYRKNASFNWKQMAIAIEEEDTLEFKYKIWNKMKNEPLFQRKFGAQSLDEQRKLAVLRMRKLKEWDLLPEEEMYINLKKLLAVEIALLSYCPSMLIKYSLAYGFIKNVVLGLGSPHHMELYEELCDPKTQIVGSFSLTEISHGTNTKAMRTTATFIPETQEFEINTPDFEAAKCWVGNLGKTSTHTVLFAQLITPDGKNNGLHAFIVPIRDPISLSAYPGVIVGDMGEKVALNGVDNGFILFKKYRIPKLNLLSKTGNVTPEGAYVTPFKDPKKKLGASLGSLSAGRVGIVSLANHYLMKAVVIATRYSGSRKQFGPNSKEEIPIIEYPLVQWRLFPYIASVYALTNFSRYFFVELVETTKNNLMGVKDDQNKGPEIHVLSCASKPFSGWLARDGIQECREICAGHGFLAASGFGELRGANDGNLTYEGDNNVLVQQTSNWLLQLWSMRDKKGIWDTPLKTVDFLSNWNEISRAKCQYTASSDIIQPDNLIKMFEWLVCYLLQSTYAKYVELRKCEKNDFIVRNNIQVFLGRTLSLVYCERFILLKFYEFASSQEDRSIKEVLMKLVSLYGSWRIEKYLDFLFEGGYITSRDTAISLKEGIIDLCSSLKNDAISLVDAISPPDFILNSPLGCADGEIYKHLQATFFQAPGTFSKPDWLDKSKL